LRAPMPLCSPAAIAAALLLLALAAMPARADDFTDAAGRRVVLPAEPRHVMAASPTAEVLVSVLAADKLAGASRAARRGVGAARDELAIYAEHAIAAVRGRLLIRQPDTRPHVYYGRRADGLETALPGSPSGEAIDEAGAIDVAAPLGRGQLVAITRDELF